MTWSSLTGKGVLAILLLSFGSMAWGQNQEQIDSVRQLLTGLSDTARLDPLEELYKLVYRKDPKEALAIGKEMAAIARAYGRDKNLVIALNAQSVVYGMMNKMDSAMLHAREGIRISNAIGYDGSLFSFYNILGNIEMGIGSLDSAVHHFKLALAGEHPQHIAVYLNLVYAYKQMGDYLSAIEYAELTLKEVELQENDRIKGKALTMLAAIFSELGNPEKAKFYLLQSLEIHKKRNDPAQQIHTLMSILKLDLPVEELDEYLELGQSLTVGMEDRSLVRRFEMIRAGALLRKGQQKEALELGERIFQESRAAGSFEYKLLYDNMVELYLANELDAQAEELALEIMEESRSNKNLARQLSLQRFLLEIYAKRRDYQRYFELAEVYYPMRDSVDNEASAARVTYLDASLKNVEREKEIEQLNFTLHQKEVRRRWLVAVSVLIGSVLLLGLYYRNRQLKIQERLTQNVKAAAQELEKANAQLKELDQLKSRFFANVSHELRTPLTLILGPVRQMIKKGSLSADDLAEAQLIAKNAEQLQRRVNEILDLTKLEAQKLRVEKSNIELTNFTTRNASLFESLAQQRQIDLQLQVSERKVYAQIDRNKVETILQNFLSNALKFTPKGGQVELGFQKQGDLLRWSVADIGRGIAESDLPYIFDRFYQVKSPKGGAEGGTGIGLALCRELADLMQGKVGVESQIGQGSRFYLELPFEAGAEVQASVIVPAVALRPEEQRKAVPVEGRSILLVEDNPDLQLYLKRLLRNYALHVSDNGEEALAFLQNNRPDLIISDVMMPVMDGFELLSRLKADEALQRIPVIMLTARADLQDKLKALRIGVDDYILKPFVQEELLARVENSLLRLTMRAPLEEEEEAEAIITPEQEWLAQVEGKVLSELQNTQFNLDQMAAELFISKRQLQRKIKGLTGMTPSEYVREIRLHQARTFLEAGRFQTVGEVCGAVGMEHQHHFSKIFAERYGKKPTDYFKEVA